MRSSARATFVHYIAVCRRSHRWLVGWTLLAAVIGCLLIPRRAAAIPAFARKYETSCQTCHIAFPKLNPFGEAFRRNGYRFPSGGDELMQKQEPVQLGNDAMKDL